LKLEEQAGYLKQQTLPVEIRGMHQLGTRPISAIGAAHICLHRQGKEGYLEAMEVLEALAIGQRERQGEMAESKGRIQA
jgi:hypothetical protein